MGGVGVLECGGCSRSGAGPYASRRTLSRGSYVVRSPPPRVDEGSYQGKRPCPCSRRFATISRWRNHMPCVCSEPTRRKVTCASCHSAVYPTTNSDLVTV